MKLNKDVTGSRRKQRARHFNAPSHLRRKEGVSVEFRKSHSERSAASINLGVGSF